MEKKVVVTDHAFPDLDFEQAVSASLGASLTEYSCSTEAETAACVRSADVVLVNFAPITSLVLQGMKPGATVIRYGVGYDNVDVAAAQRRGIQVAHVPDYGTETVADHAAASLLALARRTVVYNSRIRSEGWLRPAEIGPMPSLRAMVVGFLGMGRVAVATHARLAAFGFSFVAYDPYSEPAALKQLGIAGVDLHQLASVSHAISVHARSTAETHHIVDQDFLRRVQRGTLLVNTARGSLVDEVALAVALSAGTIAGAALDVTEHEPLSEDSPLRSFPQVILSPHAAFYDDESVRTLQRLVAEEAGRALRGESLRCQLAQGGSDQRLERI